MIQKLTIAALALCVWASCKNDTNTAKTDPKPAESVASTPAPSADEVQAVSSGSSARLEAMKALTKEMDALPQKIKADPTLQTMRSEMNDIITKADGMSKELGTAASAIVPAVGKASDAVKAQAMEAADAANMDPNTFKDYKESMDRYQQRVDEIKAKVEELKKKG